MNNQKKLAFFIINQTPKCKNYTISALNGPVQISFEYLKGGTNRWNTHGHVTLTDGDGTVLLDHATTQDVVPVLTSNSNTIHVEFVSPSRESGRGRTFNRTVSSWTGRVKEDMLHKTETYFVNVVNSLPTVLIELPR